MLISELNKAAATEMEQDQQNRQWKLRLQLWLILVNTQNHLAKIQTQQTPGSQT